MAIGDDLQILLGMVPIRDRAGIARGTMADAAAAAASNNPNAEGQTLTRQGFDRPPAFTLPPGMLTGSDNQPPADVQLPDGVNTEYASGSGGKLSPAKSPSLGKGPVPGTPTADSERVVASSPMAAPSPAVATRGSEIMRQAMEKEQRQEKMQQVFHALGQIVGGLRGESVPARAAGAGSSNYLNNMKTLIDMRAQEDQQAAALAIRKQTIDELQRTNGYSPEMAAAKYDSGEYKDDLKQENVAKREAAKRAGQTMMDLMKPENVELLAKALNMPPDVVKASIREGKIGAKELADILSTQATTAKTGVETAGKGIDVGRAQAGAIAYADAKTPEGFLKFIDQYHLTPEQGRARTVTPAVYDDFIKSRGGEQNTTTQLFQNDREIARSRGPEALAEFDKKYPNIIDWQKDKEPKRIASPGDTAAAGIIGKVGTKYADMAEEVEKSNIEREGAGRQLFRSWSPTLRAGSAFSERENRVRKSLAKAFGLTDKAGERTDEFFAQLNGAAQTLGSSLNGPLSDKDILFLKDQVGSKEMSPETLRRLIIIHDNVKFFQDEQKRELIMRVKDGDTAGVDPETVKALKNIPTPREPKVNVFIEEKLANDPQEVAGIVAHRNDPEYLAGVDHEWGRKASRYVLDKYDREHPNEGGR